MSIIIARLALAFIALTTLVGCSEGLTPDTDTTADASTAPTCSFVDNVPTITDPATGWTCTPTPGAYQGQCSCSGPAVPLSQAAAINIQLCPLVHACADGGAQ